MFGRAPPTSNRLMEMRPSEPATFICNVWFVFPISRNRLRGLGKETAPAHGGKRGAAEGKVSLCLAKRRINAQSAPSFQILPKNTPFFFPPVGDAPL
jgi:hypothetical protein